VWVWQDQGLMITSGRGDYVCSCLCYSRNCPSAALWIKTVGEPIAFTVSPLRGTKLPRSIALGVRAKSVSLRPPRPHAGYVSTTV
jgi:hypothetical protein